mmetsp:Transcript_25101/g.82279  ORF Transcript_25101/g.82279 Transcript_25101/m.82279 type:complete len:234 (+) Transcript_25101:869-1570(+)
MRAREHRAAERSGGEMRALYPRRSGGVPHRERTRRGVAQERGVRRRECFCAEFYPPRHTLARRRRHHRHHVRGAHPHADAGARGEEPARGVDTHGADGSARDAAPADAHRGRAQHGLPRRAHADAAGRRQGGRRRSGAVRVRQDSRAAVRLGDRGGARVSVGRNHRAREALRRRSGIEGERGSGGNRVVVIGYGCDSARAVHGGEQRDGGFDGALDDAPGGGGAPARGECGAP